MLIYQRVILFTPSLLETKRRDLQSQAEPRVQLLAALLHWFPGTVSHWFCGRVPQLQGQQRCQCTSEEGSWNLSGEKPMRRSSTGATLAWLRPWNIRWNSSWVLLSTPQKKSNRKRGWCLERTTWFQDMGCFSRAKPHAFVQCSAAGGKISGPNRMRVCQPRNWLRLISSVAKSK